MLNITKNKIEEPVDLTKFESGKKIFTTEYHKTFKKILKIVSILILLILFLPWTQNIKASGRVTTLKPNQRPQTIQSQIPGRIEEWFVQEGDFVKRGDTILHISEVKSEYFDERLTERTNQQIGAKTNSVTAYQNKVEALGRQIKALETEKSLKLKQARNKLKQAHLKVKSDSIDLKAAETNVEIAKTRYQRDLKLQEEGLKSVKDVEERQLKQQEALAKLISQENKYLASQNQVINAELQISTINASYNDKISKTYSDLYTAQTSQYDSEVQVSKLETNFSNYTKRSSLMYIVAPQDGYINKVIKPGIGETFKEGEQLVGIMPADYQLAVEMYVRPIDLPLIHIGESVRVQFDGWPAIVFSGWPNASYGTYGAKVVAIENFISPNGKYRILLSPDENDHAWPEVRVGSGAVTMALLDNVTVLYEIWRQLNSFPPNFYVPEGYEENKKK